MFLNFFIRKAVYDQKVFELTTPSAYLEKHDTLQILSPSPSSWGNKGFWEVWLDESNSWIYPHLHAAARRMTECARAAKEKSTEGKDRVLRQMARELLLGQSSDWAFFNEDGNGSRVCREEDKGSCPSFHSPL
jgi:1,4-alpha-glucan branching enzyme